MSISNVIQPTKKLCVNMFQNTLTIDDILIDHDVSFNCNWTDQTIIEVLDHNVLNAECHGVSMKDPNDKNLKISLPFYEYYLLKTDKHEIISLGFYKKDLT